MSKVHDENEQDKQRRLKRFKEAARAIGKEIEKSGLSEEEVMAKVEETRQKLFEDHYGEAVRRAKKHDDS